MAKLIKTTPILDHESSINFLYNCEKNIKIKSYAIPTPYIDKTIASIMDFIQRTKNVYERRKK